MRRGKDFSPTLCKGDGIHYIVFKKYFGHEIVHRFGPHFVQGGWMTWYICSNLFFFAWGGATISPPLCRAMEYMSCFFSKNCMEGGQEIYPHCAGWWNTCHFFIKRAWRGGTNLTPPIVHGDGIRVIFSEKCMDGGQKFDLIVQGDRIHVIFFNEVKGVGNKN